MTNVLERLIDQPRWRTLVMRIVALNDRLLTNASKAASADERVVAYVPLLPTPRSPQILFGGLLAILSVSAWFVLIVNRYFTIHEGWFSYYSYLMQHGKFPYRDFYFFTQPFHLLVANAVISLGDNLLYYRIYGLGERVVITTVLYFLLSRTFSAPAAVCGTVASSILFLAYPADAFASYLYTCLLFALLSVACFHQAWHTPERRSLWMTLAGVSASLSFFSKQSNGLLIIVAAGFTILVVCRSLREGLSDLMKFAVGASAAAVPFVCWLCSNGAWNAYLRQVFVGSASSKGGLHAVLFGFFSRQLTPASLVIFLLVVVALARIVRSRQLNLCSTGQRAQHIPDWLTFSAILAILLGTILAVHRINLGVRMWLMAEATEVVVNLILYALLPVLLVVLYLRAVRPDTVWLRGNEVPVALLIISVFWTYACGMSWNVAEQSLIPSLGLLLAFCYDRLQFKQTQNVSVVILLTTVFLISLGMWHKWNLAFNWEGWFERVSEHGGHSRHAEIADYRIDSAEIAIYDTILDDIAKYTKPQEPIVTFPSIPLFNYVGDHPQPTFAPVHYWDVCPDDVARRDAQRVLAARPRMIVELRLADWVWREHDSGWRQGRRSGQRDFQDALDTLTSSGDYRLLHTFLTPEYRMPLQVWVRVR